MRWEWINIDKRLFRIKPKDNKGKQDIKHRINDDAYNIFMEMGVKDSGYVFPREETGKPYRNPSRDIINKFYDKAGLDVNGFHIIRHTVGTTLAENNAPDIIIQPYLHHEDYRTSRKYTHAKPKMPINAANIISDFING